MKKAYIEKNFKIETRQQIDQANRIIAEYQAEGYDLTLRQLYYQFVSRDLLANTQRNYKNLGSVVNDGRLAGLIDWSSIVDHTRSLKGLTHWESPAQITRAAVSNYRVDRWEGQPKRAEVWIEKDALSSIFSRACNALDTSWFSCRGYTSQSEMWEAAQRIGKRFLEEDQTTVIFHFGDHDPSGMDMSRDIEDRLHLFTKGDGAEGAFEFYRVALNNDQVRKYKPPPNPAKLTDSRATAYIEAHGRSSWELDALDPKVLAALVKDHVEDAVEDEEAWARQAKRERDGRVTLTTAADKMDKGSKK